MILPCKIDQDDWWLPYNQSKLAMITWGFTLADRLDRVTVNSLHPGTYMPTKMVLDKGIPPVHTVASGVEATTRMIMDPALDMITGRFYDQLVKPGRTWPRRTTRPSVSGCGGSASSSPVPPNRVRPPRRSRPPDSAPSPVRRDDPRGSRPWPWPAR